MSSIDIRPIAGSMGAEIHGIDVGSMNEAMWAQVRQAFIDYLMIVIPDQNLTPAQFQAWGERYGPLMRHPYLKPIEGLDAIHELYKSPTDTGSFGSVWHSDLPFFEQIPRATSLYARMVPDFGGDTVFANRYLAYETLPSRYKTLLEDMEGVFKVNARYEGNTQRLRNAVGTIRLDDGATHRMVQVHPVSGRKYLLFCPLFITQFSGMTEEDSRPLIEYLKHHCTRPELTVRIRWRPNMLGIWDNWACLHFAINDYAGKERHMHRLVVH